MAVGPVIAKMCQAAAGAMASSPSRSAPTAAPLAPHAHIDVCVCVGDRELERALAPDECTEPETPPPRSQSAVEFLRRKSSSGLDLAITLGLQRPTAGELADKLWRATLRLACNERACCCQPAASEAPAAAASKAPRLPPAVAHRRSSVPSVPTPPSSPLSCTPPRVAVACGCGCAQSQEQDKERLLSYHDYEMFHLLLHRALSPPDSEWRLADARALAKRNWLVDADIYEPNTLQMSRDKFARSVQQVAKHWAEDMHETQGKCIPGLLLLADEIGLGESLETIFLTCLVGLLVTPPPAEAPHMVPALRPWFRVRLGCCSSASQGGGCMSYLGLLATEIRELGLRVRPALSRSLLNLGACPEPAAAPAPASREATGGVSVDVDGGPRELQRAALNQRMLRLLRLRRTSLPLACNSVPCQ